MLTIAPSDMELLSSMASRLSQTEQQLQICTREVIEKVFEFMWLSLMATWLNHFLSFLRLHVQVSVRSSQCDLP